MNDSERKVLVDELVAAMGAGDSLQSEAQRVVYTYCATACLPIIERLLAGERQRIRDKLIDPVMFNESFVSDVENALDFLGITGAGQEGGEEVFNCGHCTPNSDEIACACQIEERDDE